MTLDPKSQTTELAAMGLYDKPESFKPLHWFWIIGLGLIYAVTTALSWSTAYIDFGDGNYMYIAWRIAHGAVVYRDILAPQPPCHLFLGAGLVRLADALGPLYHAATGARPPEDLTLYVFRTFSLLLHLATYGLVLRLAWRAWERPVTTVVAGAIWLWLPINFWWSLGYQSEPLEIFFLLAMMAAALRASFARDLLAGLFAALAALTNATAAPFLLVLILYMIVRAPLRALRMTAVCVLLAGFTVWTLQNWTQGAFLQNAVFNQVGTWPNESAEKLWNYIVEKLITQSAGVLQLEGFFVFLALIGFWRYLATSPLDTLACGGLGWFFLATLGSIVYATKGGTEDYIFNLSEPAVAILAAGELTAWGRRWNTPLPEIRAGWIVRIVPFWLAKGAATLLLAAFALGPGLYFHSTIQNQSRFELNTDKTERLIHLIKKQSAPNQEILAPPYYAFLAQRRLWNDYSELFIWTIKYGNDRKAHDLEGEGWRKARAMAGALREGRLPLVILEMDQTGTIPEVMAALQKAYVPILSPLAGAKEGPAGYLARTYNTHLGLFTPLDGHTTQTLAFQQREWLNFKVELMRTYGLEGVYRKFGMWYDLQVAPVAPPPPAPPARIKPIMKSHAGPTSPTLGAAAMTSATAATSATLTTSTATANAPTSATATRGTTSATAAHETTSATLPVAATPTPAPPPAREAVTSPTQGVKRPQPVLPPFETHTPKPRRPANDDDTITPRQLQAETAQGPSS